MQLTMQQNARVLASLSRRRPGAPELASHDSIANPYLACGCHPDIVERLWDQLGPSLPEDCRCLIYGTPALAQPTRGLILAVGLGTQYGIRLPLASEDTPLTAVGKTTTTSSGGETLSIREMLDEDWVFGSWKEAELDWCRKNYARDPRSEPIPVAPAIRGAGTPEPSAEEQFGSIVAELEQRVLLNDPEAEFKLFQILFNAALKTRSKANLDRADALLAAAAAHGSKDALALGAVWPRLKADAQRKNSGSNTP